MAQGDFSEIVGGLSKLAGLGTVVYGVISQEIETIAGGVALLYAGKTFTSDWFKDRKESIELQRNKLLQEINLTLRSKLKEGEQK